MKERFKSRLYPRSRQTLFVQRWQTPVEVLVCRA